MRARALFFTLKNSKLEALNSKQIQKHKLKIQNDDDLANFKGYYPIAFQFLSFDI